MNKNNNKDKYFGDTLGKVSIKKSILVPPLEQAWKKRSILVTPWNKQKGSEASCWLLWNRQIKKENSSDFFGAHRQTSECTGERPRTSREEELRTAWQRDRSPGDPFGRIELWRTLEGLVFWWHPPPLFRQTRRGASWSGSLKPVGRKRGFWVTLLEKEGRRKSLKVTPLEQVGRKRSVPVTILGMDRQAEVRPHDPLGRSY